MSLLQQALDALGKAEYAEVFDILEQANVMNNPLHALKNEFEIEGAKATFAQRLEVATKKAFTHSNTHSLTHLLSHLPSPTSHFTGRAQELQTLHAHLQAGKHTMLVNGLGGVGKTTLAQKYVLDYQTDYAHILWIRQSGDLVGSFTQTDLLDELRLAYNAQTDRQALFAEVLKKLRVLHPVNLLVIDNYEPTDTDAQNDSLGKLFALPTAWRVLCTSRTDVDFFDETLRLDVLPAHEAVQMFQEYAKGKPHDATEVGELLHMIGYHTLMTELLAKTYCKCPQFNTVGKMHAYLQARSLQDQQLAPKIYMDRQATTLYAHLSTVFSLASLTEDELWVLKQWVVLPTAPHQAMDFLTWIQDTDLAYQPTLLSLTEKGWLQTDNSLAYSLHPFLQLFLHQTLKPTLPDCEKMRRYFSDLMGSNKVEAHPLAYQWTINIGEAMVQYIDFTTHEEKQGLLWNKIYNVYRLLGDYPNAIRCAKENLAINKATVGETHEEYATALICVGFIHNSQGNYAEALPLYQKALKIRKEVLGEQHPDYAIDLNNLASLYHNQGNYAEALPLYQESLQIRKEVLGERHPSYALALNNLAELYCNQGNYADALPLFQEVLQIWKEVLGERHPNYALALNNLASLYFQQENYADALPLYQEALSIRKEVLGERHPDTAISLWWVGGLYFKQKDYQQARTYFTEAYSIFLEKLGEQHPHTQNVKKWLDDLPSL